MIRPLSTRTKRSIENESVTSSFLVTFRRKMVFSSTLSRYSFNSRICIALITFILLNQQKKYILRRLGCWPIENQHQQVPAIGARLLPLTPSHLKGCNFFADYESSGFTTRIRVQENIRHTVHRRMLREHRPSCSQ